MSQVNKTAAASSSTKPKPRPSLNQILAIPPRWLGMYDEFITKNAGQVSQIESTLRSLTYVIPGRFRDAEIASESIHSGVQLLSLYHDSLLTRVVSRLPVGPLPSAHSRYTRNWTAKSKLYRRVAVLLQMVTYTQLLWEMSAKRRGGDKSRWRVVVLLEAIKAVCRLLLLAVTKSRPLVSPPLPERQPIPEDAAEEDADASDMIEDGSQLMDDELPEESTMLDSYHSGKARHLKDWSMPRTGLSMPSLPNSGDISSYLLGRVLTADDIKPAPKLLNQLQGMAQTAEILHILSPLIYAAALSRSKEKTSWTPWLVGLAAECAARRLRDHSLKTTPLEREEWNKRGWAMGWWLMRGAFYEKLTKSLVVGVTNRMPGFIGGIMEDYEYLWESYYFSTSA